MEEREHNPFRTSIPDATALLNAHDAQAFRRDLYEQVVNVLMTNTLQGSFYRTKEQLTLEALDVLFEMRRRDPEFLAKALIYGRNTGFLRKINLVGLAILSTSYNTAPFRTAFDRVVHTPDDIRDFIMICESGRVRRGFGGAARDAVRDWLNNMSEFHAIKYSGKNGMRNIINKSHPKPGNRAMEERFGWAVYGWSEVGPEPSPTNPQIWAYEKLKRETDEAAIIELIRVGRLPWEVVVPSVRGLTPAIRAELMYQMGIEALLKNLNNLERNNVFDNPDNLTYYITRITDPEALRRAKIFPFRLYQAWLAYKNRPNPRAEILAALEQAVNNTLANISDLPGKVAIGSDVSNSMNGTISDKSNVRYIDICGVLTASLYAKSNDTIVIPFEGEVITDFSISPRDSVFTITEKLAAIRGGSTAVGAPIQHMIDNNIAVDIFIGITDNQDWDYGDNRRTRSSFFSLWREYKALHPQAKAFLITIAPYREVVAPANTPDVHFVYGWNANVISYIANTANGLGSQLDEIRAIEL